MVAARDEAGGGVAAWPAAVSAHRSLAEKIEEWVERSQGKIRADKAHERLVAMGYLGSERTTRRAVAAAKRRGALGTVATRGRGSPSPGCGCSGTTATGPVIDGRETSLLCAWLAWSRFRVVIALVDRTLPSVVMALDRALRAFGGAPTYALTDNERTVTIDHVCGIAVRNPKIVAAARHYGLTIASCVPADPQSKGGSEATVRIAKADLVPTDHNLRADYASFAELEDACDAFCERVNAREHRVTRRAPAVMLARSARGCTRCPPARTRCASGRRARSHGQSTISVGRRDLLGPARADRRAGLGARRRRASWSSSTPTGRDGPREVARHQLTTPGRRASTTSTTRPGRPARWSASRARRAPTRPRSLRSGRARRGG